MLSHFEKVNGLYSPVYTVHVYIKIVHVECTADRTEIV